MGSELRATEYALQDEHVRELFVLHALKRTANQIMDRSALNSGEPVTRDTKENWSRRMLAARKSGYAFGIPTGNSHAEKSTVTSAISNHKQRLLTDWILELSNPERSS